MKKKQKLPQVTVFGGSGFLGSHVADELTYRGYGVLIADVRKSNYLQGSQQFMECDIMDRSQVKEALDGSTIVYNFAGMADLDESIRQPHRTMEQNVIGNLNILEECTNLKLRRYVYASSTYAFSEKGSFYGISKLASEKIIEEYQFRVGFPYTIIRYGSVYGERANERNGMYQIIRQALENRVVIHRGDGESVREYIHAADVGRLSVDVIESDTYVNEHLVLTGVERLKHKELYQMLEDILEHPIQIEFTGETWEGHYQVTPYSFQPNIAKKLVANPFIDLGQGMTSCIQVVHQNLENSK